MIVKDSVILRMKNRILTTEVMKKITLCGSKHVISLKIGQGPGHIYEGMFFSIIMLTL